MPGRPRQPGYLLHKPSGLAYVRLGGKDHYLGKHGTDESHQAYQRLIAEWYAGGCHLPPKNNVTVKALMAAYWKWAEAYFVNSTELRDLRFSLRELYELHGETPVDEFGPLALKAVRQKMIDALKYYVRFSIDGTTLERWLPRTCIRKVLGPSCEACWKNRWRPAQILDTKRALCRGLINQRIGRIKRMFRWGVESEMVEPRIHQALMAVEHLQRGRSAARETLPVREAPEASIEAVVAILSPTLKTMIQLQRLTGMRPGEVCNMKGEYLDMTTAPWVYQPPHKTAWLGHKRIIPLGPARVSC